MSHGNRFDRESDFSWAAPGLFGIGGVLLVVAMIVAPLTYWTVFRIYVPAQHLAVLTHKTGKNLPSHEEFAPDESYKGVQLKVLGEGRHFRNPWNWGWEVV